MANNGFSLANVVAVMGSVLIFVGMAWMIANNWHQIPDLGKTAILLAATSAAFASGVFARMKEHEGVGRALILLGGLLYIVSVILIAQIYHLANGPSEYAMMMLLMWSVVLLTAYLLDSVENCVLALLVFFPWSIVQYIAHYVDKSPGDEAVIGVTILLLCVAIIWYSMTVLHRTIKHKFTTIFQFWSAFYLLAVFYFMSFQGVIPMLAEYRFDSAIFTPFLAAMIIIALGLFAGSLYQAASKRSIIKAESIGFVCVVALLFALVLATKSGAGLVGYCQEKSCYTNTDKDSCEKMTLDTCYWKDGYCQQKNCYDQKTPSDCKDLPRQACRWYELDNSTSPEKAEKMRYAGEQVTAMCQTRYCGEFTDQAACANAPKAMSCSWMNGWCGESRSGYEICNEKSNQKELCIADETCSWRPGENVYGRILPTQIWAIWLIVNVFFIAFIILMMYYGSMVRSNKIINLAMAVFVLDIISRYIGFWMDLSGYFAFSMLAIGGGALLIIGALVIPKWHKRLTRNK